MCAHGVRSGDAERGVDFPFPRHLVAPSGKYARLGSGQQVLTWLRPEGMAWL